MLYPQNKEEIEIFITTRREGLLTKIGHDLRLSVVPSVFSTEEDRFSGSVRVVDIEIVGSLVGDGIKPMSSGDASKILKTLQKTVLEGKRYPSIHFSGAFGSPIEVELEIRKTKGFLTLEFQDGGWIGSLDHREFGIPQVKALLGALKVNPLLEICVNHHS